MVLNSPKKANHNRKLRKHSSKSTLSKNGKKSKKLGGGCCGAKKKSKMAKKHGDKKKPGMHQPRSLGPPQRHPIAPVVYPVAPAPVNRSADKSTKSIELPVQKVEASEPKKKLEKKKEAPLERESKVVKSKPEARLPSPEQPADEPARTNIKTEQSKPKVPENETVVVEELAMKTYEQGGRLHRTFSYHISRPLPSKPAEEEKPLPPKPVEEEKLEKKGVEVAMTVSSKFLL